jgi:hypothetical protein
VQKLVIIVGTSIAGWIGWWLGAKVGLFSALVVSLVFTAAALYVLRRMADEYLGG